MKILYEVSIRVTPQILEKYRSWLKPHAEHVVRAGDFLSYSLWEHSLNSGHEFVVHYEVKSQGQLDHYLNHIAPQLREEAHKIFGSDFSIARRILKQAS